MCIMTCLCFSEGPHTPSLQMQGKLFWGIHLYSFDSLMVGSLGDAGVTTLVSFPQVSFGIRLPIIISISYKVGYVVFRIPQKCTIG